jgi:hypothetical protein
VDSIWNLKSQRKNLELWVKHFASVKVSQMATVSTGRHGRIAVLENV